MHKIPGQEAAAIAQTIERELGRPQANRVLHAHPSPLQWNRDPIDFRPHHRARLSGPRSQERKLGVYLGIPFCIPTDPPHCGFCLFPTEEYKGKSSVDVYLEFLEKEADMVAALNPACDISSIYVGGGTPNLLRGSQYERLMQVIGRAFGSVPKDIEITLEGIPQLYNEERVSAIKAAGFNRVSMGVQQINDDLVKYSGRNQTRKQIFEAIGYFQKYGLAFNVDLIFGWPEQTIPSMLSDLEALVATGIQHLTHYELNIGGISDFALAQRKNLPERGTVDQMYLEARNLLLSHGFVQKTVFDWERPVVVDPAVGGLEHGHEYAFEDNLRRLFEVDSETLVHSYEMLGMGYAAISFAAGFPQFDSPSWTSVNTRTLQKYYKRVDAGEFPLDAYFFRSPVDVKISWLFQALQETKIDVARYNATFSEDLYAELAPLWGDLQARGWIECGAERISVPAVHHLKIPVVQTLIAAARRDEIVAEHRRHSLKAAQPVVHAEESVVAV